MAACWWLALVGVPIAGLIAVKAFLCPPRKARVPEGGAIEGTDSLNCRSYSELMRVNMARTWRPFATAALAATRKIASDSGPGAVVRVLEIGPGPGWIGITVAEEEQRAQVVGVEPSAGMRAVATENAAEMGVGDRVRFEEGVAERLSALFPAAQFDVVISHHSLHHWESPAAAFREIRRMLRPNGVALIEDMPRDLGIGETLFLYAMRPVSGPNWRFWKSSIWAAYTVAELRALLVEAGCNDAHWKVERGFHRITISRI